MIPVLFYAPGTCAFGSIVALEWAAQPYRLCRLDEETLTADAYRKLNPLHQVPTFKSGEGVITESAAILQHIGFIGIGKKIAYKQGTFDYDHLNQMMAYLTTQVHTAIGPIVHPDRAADHESSQEDVKHKAVRETVPAKLKIIEDAFKGKSWLAGNQPTIADAYFYGIARKAKEFINLDKDFPKIADFLVRFGKDPGVLFAEGIEKGTSPKSSGGFKGDVPFGHFA